MKRLYYIPMIVLVISLIMLFRPAGRITFDKSVSENRILVRYEIYGCGSLITKVLDGGEELALKYKKDYPDIGTNEVVFTKDRDEPKKHYDNAEFFTGGLAENFSYIVEGESVGVTKGAPECCSPDPAYNEHVVEFKVDKWYYTSYVPNIVVAGYFELFIPFGAGVCSIIILVLWGFIAIILKIFKKKKN